jgi:transposase
LGGIEMSEASFCPRCRSNHISKTGYRFSNEGKVARQRYKCLDCEKWFLAEYIENPGVPKRKIDLRDFEYQNQPVPSQNWTAYTQAQNNEKRVLQNVLKELLDSVEIKVLDGKLGRHYSDMKDMCFCLSLKTYTKLSSRRLNTDLEKTKYEEFINKTPHFTTLMNWLEKEEMTQLLLELIKLSALPIKPIESQYAIDSSGFSSSQFGRWFNYKYNEEKICRNWVKAHIMIGTKTNIVTSVELTKAHGADSPQLQPLIEKTCKNFNVKEVSADKAYSSRKNLQIIVDHGAIPFIPFKSNSRSLAHGIGIWKNMYHFFHEKPQDFFEKYHRRSNVETTFSMIKQKFGKDVMSRNFQSQTNEVLLKILCHNICCLIQEYYENNIESYYSTEKPKNQAIIRIG